MANTTSIPTGLNIPSQIPLDTVRYVLNESALSNLGTNNYLAFIYFKNLIIHCFEENSNWIWREVEIGEENTGLLSVDYEYPYNHFANGINYSNKKYNFFKYEIITTNNLHNYINGNNLGNGVSLYKNKTILNDLTNLNFKTLKSNTLSILNNENENEINIEILNSNSIPSLYVNNLYVPSYNEWFYENLENNNGVPNVNFIYKGKGTLSKPFTDSIKYTLNSPLILPTITQNTSIQNALDSYVGTGTRLNPEKSGQKIIIQNNNSIYNFNGDFNYSNLDILIDCNINCLNTGYLIDMDNNSYFDNENAGIKITLGNNVILDISNTLGFNNSGNSITTSPSYIKTKIILLHGENGQIFSNYNGPDILTKYILNSNGNNNNDGLHYEIKCKILSYYQGIYYSKNKTRIDFYNSIKSGEYLGNVNLNLKAFHMTGGQIRFFEKGSINIGGENSGRLHGITFEPLNLGINYCNFYLNSAIIYGNCKNLFCKLNDENVVFLASNSISNYGFSTTLPGTQTITNGLFENLGNNLWNVNMSNCIFSHTGLDFEKVDLTNGNNVSCINTINGNVIESLVVFNNRANAIAAGRPINSIFLNRGNPGTPEGDEINNFPITGKWYRDIVLPN